jgi:transcriptional regulator with XRE-family HTH domain
MKIQPIGHQLKSLRSDRKKTLQFVAEKINATSSYVSQLENGVRNPSDSSLLDILTKAYELEENAAEKLIRSWRINQYTSDKTVELEESANQIMLPFYKKIEGTVDATQAKEMRSFYLDPSLKASDYFLWEMNDNSMEPTIPQGAILLINKDILDIPYHGLVLARTSNNLEVRHYQKQPDRIKLFAANPNFPVFFGQNIPIYGHIEKMLVNI